MRSFACSFSLLGLLARTLEDLLDTRRAALTHHTPRDKHRLRWLFQVSLGRPPNVAPSVRLAQSPVHSLAIVRRLEMNGSRAVRRIANARPPWGPLSSLRHTRS